MFDVILEERRQVPVEEQRVELVERKGAGHPDSICDAMMEQLSVDLCHEYLAAFGRILHHNVDKSLLVAGRSEPRPGGGVVLEPMRLVLGDRATAECAGRKLDVGAIAEASAKAWLSRNLRYVDPDRHLIFQNELRPGSPELTDLYEREVAAANDTSAGVGYAPLSETEELVLTAERHLSSPEFRSRFPEAGEDVKVMAYRRDRELRLTVALAFVDRHVPDARTYFSRKEEIRAALADRLAREQRSLERIVLNLNTLDDPSRGERGMYLTVLGTSAEGADCGQVGRGNRANGLIAFHRPMTTEAAAGKNPVRHTGKIYGVLSHRLAAEIHAGVPGLREVYVWLCSQIGRPIDEPLVASAQLVLQPGVALADVQAAVESTIRRELAQIGEFTARLARGELLVW